jgi:hypothetical protein
MCRVHRRLGSGHAWSLVRLAARQLAGRTASARSGCVGSIDRAPSSAINHHRNGPISRADPSSSSGHRVHRILRGACGCDDGSATRRTGPHDLAGRLRSEGKKCPAHPRSGRIESAHRAPRRVARVCDTAQRQSARATDNCGHRGLVKLHKLSFALFQIPASLFVNFSGPGQFTSAFQVPASSRQLHFSSWSYVSVPELARRTVGQSARTSGGSHSVEEDIDWRFKC